MKKLKIIVCLPLLLLLTGCWDSDEIERMFYVHAVGIDFVDGEYEVYLQIINFQNIAKSEQPTQSELQSNVNSAKGRTPDEAIFKLYNSIDEKVYWGHLSFIIFSEEALKEGKINSVLNLFTRYIDTRYNVWIYSTDSSISDVLLTTTLLQRAISLTKLGDPLNSYEINSFIEPLNMRQLILELNEPSHESKIPFITLNDKWQSQTGPVKSIQFEGVTVINRNTVKGKILKDKAKGLQWMTNHTKRSPVVTKVPDDGNNYMTVVITEFKVKILPVVKNGTARFDIQVQGNAFLNSFTKSVQPKEVIKGVQKQIKEDILATYKEGLQMDADVYQLSEWLYRKDLKTWKKLNTDGKVKLSEDSIRNIDVTINKLISGRKDFIDTLD